MSVLVPTVASITPTFRAPYVDPDEGSPYLEVAKAREFEVRLNSGATLVAKIARTVDILDAFRGDLIDACDSTTSRTNVMGTGTLVQSTDTAAGFTMDGTSLKLACTTLQASTVAESRLLGLSAGTPVSYTDLSGLTTLQAYIRASTTTNLSAIRVIFYFSGSTANWARFDLLAASVSTVAMTLFSMTKASPTATGGTVNWAQVYGVGYQVLPTASTYSGNVWMDTLRFAWTLDTTYKWRARWLDNNAAGEWGPWPGAYRVLKVSANPTVGAGAAASTTDPTPTITWTFTGSGGKAQASALIQVYNGSGVAGSLIHTATQVGTGLTYSLPPGLLAQGQTWTAKVTAYDTDGLSSAVTLAAVGPMVLVQPHEPTGPGPASTTHRDQYARAVVDGFGSADTGGAYTTGGGAAGDFDIAAAGPATIVASTAVGRSVKLADTNLEEDGYLEWSLDKVPTTADVWVGCYLRFDNATTYYRLMAYVANGTGTVGFSVTPVVAGVAGTTMASAAGPTIVAGTRYAFRWRVTGATPTRVQAKMWVAGTPEPDAWTIDGSSSDAALQDAGTHLQVQYQVNATPGNLPITLSLHRLLVNASEPDRTHTWFRGDLAAATIVGATNIKPRTVGGLRIGSKVIIGSGYTTETAVVVGPQDGSGNFTGTPGSGGTGADLDRSLLVAHSTGEGVRERSDILTTYEAATSWATITWDTTEVDATRFYAYQVERLEGSGVWRRIATITDRAIVEYVDQEAPVGQSTAWRVITDNGTLQSDPGGTEASLVLPGGTPFYWVVPGTTYALAIKNVTNMGRRYPQDVDAYTILGRTTTVEERGEVREPDVTIQGILLPGQAGDVVPALLYAAAPANGVAYGVLKDNLGKLYRGLPKDIQDPPSERIPRARDLSFSLTVTAV